MKRSIIYLLLIAVLAVGCKNAGGRSKDNADGKPTITVTIEPLRYFTEAIAGDNFNVVSMVPRGSSPETYDPTPQQLVALAQSKAYFRIGYIGFEQTWMDKLTDNAPHLQFFDTSRGVELIYDSSHAHHHHHGDSAHGEPESAQAHTHASQAETSTEAYPPALAVEPHIWSSAYNAQIIAGNILDALCTIDKAHESEYVERYNALCHRIERTDSILCHTLASPGARRSFMIYHPALSYFARDYGLHQISIEEDGKEPSPAHLKDLINTCREEQVSVIFVQPEFDRRNAEIIARQTGTKVVPINPLAYDWEEEMLHIGRELQAAE